MDYLNKSPYFQSSGGSDHFVLHSINQMMVFYANAPCTRLYELCFNCTKLSIDAYSPGVFDYLDRHAFMSHKWLSIPFPSTYHHSSAVVTPPWNAINRVPHYLDRVYEVERPYALCFVGSTMVTAKLQRLLRQELIAVCSARSGECFHVALETHQSHESIFKPSFSRDTEGRASEDKKHNNNPYSRAKLCLTPGIDHL